VIHAADPAAEIFSDDFSTLDPAWSDSEHKLAVEGNKLIVKPLVNRGYHTEYGGTLVKDADIRVKVTQVSGGVSDSDGGITFWKSPDTAEWYEAAIKSDGTAHVVRIMQGKQLFPVSEKAYDSIKKGLNQVNELRVVTKGKMATFYINGQQIATFKGFPPDGGSEFGVYAESGEVVYVWQFSDLMVLKPQ